MSKTATEKIVGYGKLLDAWRPPEDAGEPVGCLATTFTFSADFFEEECLLRFLNMQSCEKEDGAAYLIEREEKLTGVKCASVLVDQHHCRGSRNLRWDLLSARLPRGILHAKVSLLYWSGLIRLIISSANITKPGYRLNREIFGVIDFVPDGEGPIECLKETITFLENLVQYAGDDKDPSPAMLRWLSLLDDASKTIARWKISEYNNKKNVISVLPLFIAPKDPNAFKKLKKLWPVASSPKWAYVTSPFFDPPEAENLPAKELWKHLSKRGVAEVTYNIIAEEQEDSKVISIHAPKSLKTTMPMGRVKTKIVFAKISEEDKSAARPLHMKSLWLENDTYAQYMIGSSNFTSAGLGLSSYPNIEANLVYIVNSEKNKNAYRKLDKSYLYGKAIDEKKFDLRWKPAREEGEDSPLPKDVFLHHAFGRAIFYCDTQKGARLELSFNFRPPVGWRLYLDDKDKVFFDEKQWKAMEAPLKPFCISWTQPKPPSGFDVSWTDCTGKAWWPVNLSAPESLPPPDVLRNLSLENLINILTSSRPLHESMERLIKKKNGPERGKVKDLLDPHKRVDTSGFILQRTRRISWALNGLRERLERPMSTVEALRWRIFGPIGAVALCDAILREGENDYERAFLLAELVLELSRVQPRHIHRSITPQDVQKELYKAIRKISSKIPSGLDGNPKMKSYVKNAFKEALK